MTMPDWVVAAIDTKTGTDLRSGGRKARATTCGKCRAPVLVGLDADRCAFTVTVDPHPLSNLGEAQALLAGRQTYAYERTGAALWHRDPGKVRWAAAETVICLPEHLCQGPALDVRTLPPVASQTPKVATDVPPF